MYDSVLEFVSLLLVLLAIWIRVWSATRRWAPRHHRRYGSGGLSPAAQAEVGFAASTRSMNSPTDVPDSRG
jgi:hypothetical protein